MNYVFTKVLSLTIFLMGFLSITFGQDCMLPSPVINIIETTETSISVEWEPIDGAVAYQLNLYLYGNQELIQQIQTEETSYTFNDLSPGTFYEIGSQSGCTLDTYGPETQEKPKAYTRNGLVIIVDDLRIEEECEGGVTAYGQSFQASVNYDPLVPLLSGRGILLKIEITGNAPSMFLNDFFEVVVFENNSPSMPGNLSIAILQYYMHRIAVDQQSNSIFINNPNNPNQWYFVCKVKDILNASTNMVEVGWGMDVITDSENCVDYSIHIPTGQHLVAQPTSTVTPGNTPGEHSTATSTKQSSTTISSPVAYPNPVSDRLTIELPTQGGNVQIMDINGKVWHQVNTQDLRLTVDMNNWPTGTYILRYDDGKTPHIQRVIKL
jgi:hypothetical protein